jgi:hypothetical protein
MRLPGFEDIAPSLAGSMGVSEMIARPDRTCFMQASASHACFAAWPATPPGRKALLGSNFTFWLPLLFVSSGATPHGASAAMFRCLSVDAGRGWATWVDPLPDAAHQSHHPGSFLTAFFERATTPHSAYTGHRIPIGPHWLARSPVRTKVRRRFLQHCYLSCELYSQYEVRVDRILEPQIITTLQAPAGSTIRLSSRCHA